MIVQVGVPAGAALFQGFCEPCQHSFGVLLSSLAIEATEVRPRFCPLCAGRVVCGRLQLASPPRQEASVG